MIDVVAEVLAGDGDTSTLSEYNIVSQLVHSETLPVLYEKVTLEMRETWGCVYEAHNRGDSSTASELMLSTRVGHPSPISLQISLRQRGHSRVAEDAPTNPDLSPSRTLDRFQATFPPDRHAWDIKAIGTPSDRQRPRPRQ